MLRVLRQADLSNRATPLQARPLTSSSRAVTTAELSALLLLYRRRMLTSIQQLAPAAVSSASPYGVLSVDELRRHLALYPFDGSFQPPRPRGTDPLGCHVALRDALDSASPPAVARALADLFRVLPIPTHYAFLIFAGQNSGGRGAPPGVMMVTQVERVNAILEDCFAHALAPVPLVLWALVDLVKNQDALVRQELVVLALRRRVLLLLDDGSSAGLSHHQQLALGALSYMGVPGYEALVEVFGLSPHVTDELKVAYVLAMMQRRWLKDVVRFLCIPAQASLVDSILAVRPMPRPAASSSNSKEASAAGFATCGNGPPLVESSESCLPIFQQIAYAHSSAALSSTASPQRTILETINVRLIEFGKGDLARSLAKPSLLRQMTLIRTLQSMGKEHLAGRAARDLRIDLNTIPDVRLSIKRSTLSGLLRLPARDLVLAHCRKDAEAEAALLSHLEERVRIGKSSQQAADAFLAAVAQYRSAVHAWEESHSSASSTESATEASAQSHHDDRQVHHEQQHRHSHGLAVEAALALVDVRAHQLYGSSRSGTDGGKSSSKRSRRRGKDEEPVSGAITPAASKNGAEAAHTAATSADLSQLPLPSLPPPDFLIPAPLHLAQLTPFSPGPVAAATSASGGCGTNEGDKRDSSAGGLIMLKDEQGYLRLPVREAVATSSTTGSSLTSASDCISAIDAAGPVSVLPPEVAVSDVRSLTQLQRVVQAIYIPTSTTSSSWPPASLGSGSSSNSGPRLIGIDCEWVSPMLPTDDGQVAVLTVAHGDSVWLVDLPSLHTEAETGHVPCHDGSGDQRHTASTSSVLGCTAAAFESIAHEGSTATVPAPAAASDDSQADRRRALNETFAQLFCSPGLPPSKAPIALDGGGSPPPLRCVVLVYGGVTDFSMIAGSYPYLTAFRHTTTLSGIPVPSSFPSSSAATQPAGGTVQQNLATSPSCCSSIAYLDLMTLSRRYWAQLPVIKAGEVAPLEQPVPTHSGSSGSGAPTVAAADVSAPLPATDESEEAAAALNGTAVEAADGDTAPAADAQAEAPVRKSNEPGSGGLSGLCHRLLGRPINKYWQMSDWRRRPLLGGQREYAAIDAWVLPLLLGRLGALQAQLRVQLPAPSAAAAGAGHGTGTFDRPGAKPTV